MKKFLLSLMVMALGCASAGTVGTKASEGLLEPVIRRTDAYLEVSPDYPQADRAAYEAAKITVRNTYAEERTAASASYLAVEKICAVHDAFVTADTKLQEMHRSTYLRSTALLRRMYGEALGAREGPASRPFRAGVPPECTDGACSIR